MVNNITECEFDTDCPGTLVCIQDVSWLDDNYESKCDCDPWFGFTGDECEDFGPGAIFYTSSVCFQLTVAIASLLCCTLIIWRVIKSRQIPPTVCIVTLVLSFLASSMAIAWRTSVLVVLVTIERFGEIDIETYDMKHVKQHPVAQYEERTFIGVTVVFAFAAALNVSLVWIDTASKAASLKNIDKMKRYRQIVIFLIVSWVLGIVILYLSTGSGAYIFYLGALYIFAIYGTFRYGQKQLTSLIQLLNSNDQKFRGIIENINITVKYEKIGGILVLLGGTVYALLSTLKHNREFQRSREISPLMVFNEVIPLGIIMIILGVVRYLWFTIGKITSAKSGHDRRSSDSTPIKPIQDTSNNIILVTDHVTEESI